MLNQNPPGEPKVYDIYMKGTINGNIESLTQLIFERINR